MLKSFMQKSMSLCVWISFVKSDFEQTWFFIKLIFLKLSLKWTAANIYKVWTEHKFFAFTMWRSFLKCEHLQTFTNFIQVGTVPSFHRKMTPVSSAFDWQSYNEAPASSGIDDSTTANALLEQIKVTRDSSDYLWYMTE